MRSTSGFFDRVRAIFSDMDGTLTTGGRLRASTYATLEALDEAGVAVVVVTGRPAGWAEPIARMWPVRGAIAENGGVLFVPGPHGMRKLFGYPAHLLPAERRRMHVAARAVMRRVPGAQLSVDAPYTEVNLALDWNEDVHLPEESARTVERLLRARGYRAVRSSVHVNFWPGTFDKLTACKRMIAELWGRSPRTRRDLAPYLYVGDALNDEPLFAGFPRSVGVANVKSVWSELAHKPAHVTRAAEGRGFEEVARAVLRARKARPDR